MNIMERKPANAERGGQDSDKRITAAEDLKVASKGKFVKLQ